MLIATFICQKCFWTATIYGTAKKRGQYSFECYDITDPDHPSELSIWQRGTREASTAKEHCNEEVILDKSS
ncbi:MAG: hypothetical protein WCF03_00635 [Nitrososphaeraceae archaeon]